MDFANKLKHSTELWTKTGQNSSAESIFTLRKIIKCLIWGSKSRNVQGSQPQSSTVTVDFTILVLGNEIITVGDQLKNGKDINGILLFDKVEVMRVNPIIRRDTGIFSKELSVMNIRG